MSLEILLSQGSYVNWSGCWKNSKQYVNKMGHHFPKPVFWGLRRQSQVCQHRWRALDSIWESGFVLEKQNLCCTAAWSACNCCVLTADWESCLNSVVCSIKQYEEGRVGLVSSGMIEDKVVTPCFSYICSSDGTNLPLLTSIQIQPGRSQQGLD